MKLDNRFLRIGVAVAVAGVVSLQVPFSGDVALARDVRCGFVKNGSSSTGNGGSGSFTGGAIAVAGGAAVIGTAIALTGSGAGAGAGAAAILAAGATATIYGVLEAQGAGLNGSQYTIITDLITRSGLQQELGGNGKEYTFFAPTDAAFKKKEKETPGFVDNLKKPENKEQLIAFIKAHIVDQRYTPDQLGNLSEGTLLTSETGSKITINGIGGLYVNGTKVTAAPLSGSNGSIVGIDTVLTGSDR